MDEILRYPQTAPVAPRSHAAPRIRLPQLGQLRLPALPRFMERRSAADPALFLAVAASLLSAGVLANSFSPSYQVTVNGVLLGQVRSYQAVEMAMRRVESRASRILGYQYTLDQAVDYKFHVVPNQSIVPVSGVENYLFEQIGEVSESSTVTLGGETLGAVEDAAALDALLESLKAPYVHENTVSAEFVEPLTVTRGYTATAELASVDALSEALRANRVERVDYTVAAGDTFSGIAADHGMTMEALQSLNPEVSVDVLQVGQTLTLSQAAPVLSVRTVDNETYDGPVPFEVQEIPDDTMYEGDSRIITPGADGFATFNANVTYVNGEEQKRTILSAQIHTQPTTQVVAVGTVERPRTMATGHFQWPLSGTLTSNYGTRYIFGSYSFHSGLDIAAPYGTAIAAADGGKVVFAGTGTGVNWSYGNYVMIDHENGMKTIYAHCSSLCVSAGDRVYKGQTIAKVGSTGRSTGNHCHFQVKSNDVTVSPWDYLP